MATIENQDPNQTAFSVKGAPGQLPSLMDIQKSDGTSVFTITKDGDVTAHALQSLKYTTAYSSLQNALLSNWNNSERGGCALFVPAGIHTVVDTAQMPSCMTLCGEGKKSSILSWYGDETVYPVGHDREGEGVDGLQLTPTVWAPDEGQAGFFKLRDIGLYGNAYLNYEGDWSSLIPNKCGITVGANPNQSPPRPEYRTYYELNFDSIRGSYWSGSAVNISTGTEGWGGFNRIYASDFAENGGCGILTSYDQRPWGLRDVHVHKCGKLGSGITNYGIALTTAWPIYMSNCVVENLEYGVAIQGSHDGQINNLYMEGVIYGLSLYYASNMVIGPSYWYSVMYGIDLQHSPGVFIHHMDYSDVYYPISFHDDCSGTVARNIGAGTGAAYRWLDITNEPYRVDKLNSNIKERGTEGCSAMVKTTTGAPTDALFGSAVGTMVYNSFDKVMYVHGPDGADDWDVM